MTKITEIPFQKTGYFSKLINHYLEENENLRQFYSHYPNLKGFEEQISKTEKSFSKSARLCLVNVLKRQYKSIKTTEATQKNVQLLADENTFTITTGHQLNLFTGPLYFLYKIISVINLCEILSQKFPDKNFVPIYWMASEDHDFEEIKSFNFKGEKISWQAQQSGAVGGFSTAGLEIVFEKFSKHVGTTKNASYLKKLFFESYLKHQNLADATRYLINSLFGKYGLIVLDANHRDLKRSFIPFIKDELCYQTSYKQVSKTIMSLQKNYKIQVNTREINLFYLYKKIRERIVFQDNCYKVKNTNLVFSKKEILETLEEFPERFSPNVIMRPLYQQVILPNICYVGGGGELAYWLELKTFFEKAKVEFPILSLRNSVEIISEKQRRKMNKLSITDLEIFLKSDELIAKKVMENQNFKVDFDSQKDFLKKQFKYLKEAAEKTDISFVGAVNAQEKKQLNGLKTLEKRWLRAEKIRQKQRVEQIISIKEILFPSGDLQERQCNFSEYYLCCENFIEILKKSLNPLQFKFLILELQ